MRICDAEAATTHAHARSAMHAAIAGPFGGGRDVDVGDPRVARSAPPSASMVQTHYVE